jgi:hypothetical protein
MRRLLLLPLLIALAAPAAAAADVDPDEFMKRVTEVYAREVKGVTACETVTTSKIRATMYKLDSRSRMWVVSQDGQPVRARVLELIKDGRPDEAERKKLEQRTDGAFRKGENRFKAPYDPRHLKDYHFEPAPNEKCAVGEVAIAFTSPLKDEQHGAGVLVTTTNGHVKRLRYSPNVLPKNVTSGVVRLELGPVTSGHWRARRMTLDYKGAMGPMSGSFELVQRFENYRKFASVEAALAAVPGK